MANGKNDIRLHVGWLRHYKTEMLRENLGDGAALCLLQLWFYAAEHRTDGVLGSMSPAVIEAAAGWKGGKGKFYEQLIQCGWLDADNVLHDWDVEQPFISKSDERRKLAQETGAEGGRRSAAARASTGYGERDARGRFGAKPKGTEGDRSGAFGLDRDDARQQPKQAEGPPSESFGDSPKGTEPPFLSSPLRLLSDPSEHIYMGNPPPEKPKEAEVRSSDETLLTALLVTKTACAEGAARKQIVTLLEHFGAERIEAAIAEHAKPAMPPWEFGKIASNALNGEVAPANGAALPPTVVGNKSDLLARLEADKAKSDALKAEFDAWCAVPGNENKTRRDFYEERRRANG